MTNKYELRSGMQYEMLYAISLVEKARYLSECSQQLNNDTLKKLLPVLKGNLNKLESIATNAREYDLFHLDLNFILKCSLHSHRNLIRAIESSNDNKTLYEQICSGNTDNVLSKLCTALNTLWLDYWKHFHNNQSAMEKLLNLEDQLIPLYSAITLKGNETIAPNTRCLSCILDSAYVKTGRLNMCDDKIENRDMVSLNYCYHLVDTKKESIYCNINRAIFERRLNERGVNQH